MGVRCPVVFGWDAGTITEPTQHVMSSNLGGNEH